MTPSNPRARRRTAGLTLAAAAVTGLALAAPTTASADSAPSGKQAKRITVQLLSFNDFHGNLEPPAGSSGRVVTGHALNGTAVTDTTVDAGGVEYLAAHLKAARKGKGGKTLTVAAGDIVGASPLLSAAFHDEPTIEAMNKLGLDVTAVGNHEFDEGYKEIQRLAQGGCLPDGDGENNQNSCPAGRFPGADFDILAANVKYEGTDKTILPAYSIKEVNGAKIGFIGMTLEGTPNIVTQAGVAGLDFSDEVETANALVPKLKRKGVDAVVVLVHEGSTPGLETWTGPDGVQRQVNPAYDAACGSASITGALNDIATNLSPAIDMVISGHTHQPYVCTIPDPAGQPRMVTSASSFGRLFTETSFVFDRTTNDIDRSTVASANEIADRTVPKDPAQTRLINRYTKLVAPLRDRELGSITEDITRTANAGGESALGDLIADAQLADDSVESGGKVPVIAFMNPGGIRTDLVYAPSGTTDSPGKVSYGEAFAVQPFNNYLVSLDLTGAQIKALLTQQWSGANAATSKILQVSEGFAYSSSGSGASRTLGAVTLDGVALDDAQTYRVVTNNFLADGGDGFPAFTQGTDKFIGGLDIDAFADYLAANSPYAPVPLDRITYTP